MPKYKQIVRMLAVAVVIGLSYGVPGVAIAATKSDQKSAQTTTIDGIQAVAQSYGTAKPLQQGLIVQLDDKNKANVTLATYNDSKKMFGVVVPVNGTAVSLSSGNQTTYVVTSGRYNVLVSTQNGAIAAGDWVSISAADGIGMKADGKEDYILGRAVTAFNGKSNVISTTTLKQTDGTQMKVAFGTVQVDIGIKPNPAQTGNDSGVPSVIQKLAVSVVGKPITSGQLWASAAILLTGVAVMGSLLYGGIQTSMISIGRNPLARKSIMRNLLQVIITAVMIFLGCLVAVYLILKL